MKSKLHSIKLEILSYDTSVRDEISERLVSAVGASNVLESRSFMGADELNIILSVLAGSGVIISQLARVIVWLIKHKMAKSIKANGVEMSGYSVKEAEKILRMTKPLTDSNQSQSS